MTHIRTGKMKSMFTPVAQSRSLQAATMILPPGGESGDRVENEHPKSEQWLFVESGTATARVGDRSVKLSPGSLLLIEKGERHQIRNTGTAVLRTINFYCPPAYTATSGVKPSVQR